MPNTDTINVVNVLIVLRAWQSHFIRHLNLHLRYDQTCILMYAFLTGKMIRLFGNNFTVGRKKTNSYHISLPQTPWEL